MQIYRTSSMRERGSQNRTVRRNSINNTFRAVRVRTPLVTVLVAIAPAPCVSPLYSLPKPGPSTFLGISSHGAIAARSAQLKEAYCARLDPTRRSQSWKGGPSVKCSFVRVPIICAVILGAGSLSATPNMD